MKLNLMNTMSNPKNAVDKVSLIFRQSKRGIDWKSPYNGTFQNIITSTNEIMQKTKVLR